MIVSLGSLKRSQGHTFDFLPQHYSTISDNIPNMLSSDQNIDNISRLLKNAKKYGDMRLDSFERSTVEKLSTVISGIIMGAIILLVSMIAVIFISAAVVMALVPHVGGTMAMLIVGGFYAVVLLMVYNMRRTLILIPIKAALARVFFAERAEVPAPTAEEMKKAKQAVMDDYESFTAPPPPANNRFEQAMQTASKAWSIADGVIMGYKLYRRFNKFFGGKRRR